VMPGGENPQETFHALAERTRGSNAITFAIYVKHSPHQWRMIFVRTFDVIITSIICCCRIYRQWRRRDIIGGYCWKYCQQEERDGYKTDTMYQSLIDLEKKSYSIIQFANRLIFCRRELTNTIFVSSKSKKIAKDLASAIKNISKRHSGPSAALILTSRVSSLLFVIVSSIENPVERGTQLVTKKRVGARRGR